MFFLYLSGISYTCYNATSTRGLGPTSITQDNVKLLKISPNKHQNKLKANMKKVIIMNVKGGPSNVVVEVGVGVWGV